MSRNLKQTVMVCTLVFISAAGTALAKPKAAVFGAYALVPFVQRVTAQVYGSDDTVAFEGGGNAAAEAALVMGQQNFAAMSRPISTPVLDLARSRNVHISDHLLGYDAFFLFVHPSSHLTLLTVPVIRSLFSCSVTKWEQVPEANLTGPIAVVATRSQQATLAAALGLDRLGVCVQVVEAKGLMLEIVHTNALAIGCSGDNVPGPNVNVLVAINAEAAAVAPTLNNVRSGRYPLFVPLHIYTAEGGSRPGSDTPSSILAESLTDRSLTDQIAMDLDIVTPYWDKETY